jgi:hypothetical protein
MVAVDQDARRNHKPWADIDRANTAEVKDYVRRYGWIRASVFGRQAEADAALLVQHADHDPEFQKEVLAIYERLRKTGEFRPVHYAYLYDRVAMHRPDAPPGVLVVDGAARQRYGTQGTCRDGRWEPFPLERPAEVDRLRAEVGLEPLERYRTRFRCPGFR